MDSSIDRPPILRFLLLFLGLLVLATGLAMLSAAADTQADARLVLPGDTGSQAVLEGGTSQAQRP